VNEKGKKKGKMGIVLFFFFTINGPRGGIYVSGTNWNSKSWHVNCETIQVFFFLFFFFTLNPLGFYTGTPKS
jgi:hypothetical protein